MLVRVITVDKSCRSTLFLFYAVDFFVVLGVPGSRRIIESSANHSIVGNCLQ